MSSPPPPSSCVFCSESGGGGDVEDVGEKKATMDACDKCGAPGTTSTSNIGGGGSSSFLDSYRQHVIERSKIGLGIPPKPLDANQVTSLIQEFTAIASDDTIIMAASSAAAKDDGGDSDKRKEKKKKRAAFLLDLLSTRVPPGVDDAAKVKAQFLTDVATGKRRVDPSILPRERSIELLGTMQGGYNVAPLVELLCLHSSDPRLARFDPQLSLEASKQLKHTLLVYDALDDIAMLHRKKVKAATDVLQSWSKGEWFLSQPKLAEKLTVTVFKVVGETNTDDLSPAQDAWSRPDIPLHACSMLKNKREGVNPDQDGVVGPLRQLAELKKKGYPLAYVGDVVGTGSSRKSATNSVLWHMGSGIPFVPNVKRGGICIGGKIAPIFFNTMEDSGALPIECDVSLLSTGDVIDVYPYEGVIKNHETDEIVAEFQLKTPVLLDEVRAGGRIPLIIGRSLTQKARQVLVPRKAQDISDVFCLPQPPANVASIKGWTLAQKIVGRACGLPDGQGIAPGQYCEPHMSSVGSQDTTGPMTRDEIKTLACIKFMADLVMQSFCHTAAYPKPVDIQTHKTLPGFFKERGGIALKPGDGIIHAWINRMVLPDCVGTGGDSHTRFPIGISFPAGSGLVAFAAASGIMPLDMPESVLVKFVGTMQPGITIRDLVQAIPYMAIQQGLLTVEKENKKNVFSGRIIEIEGLEHLQCEQAFELTCSAAERSAAACTIKLDKQPVIDFVKSNVTLLKWLITKGYGDATCIRNRISQMEGWLSSPTLLEADPNAEYAAVLTINMDDIKQPILALPNDPDACALLSEVQGTDVQEVFIGSCMMNIGHFRASSKVLDQYNTKNKGKPLPTKLWMAPPTKMDKSQLRQEGHYSIFCQAGARLEIPGCSLCMGNQARVCPSTTVVSTSTRNFPNRLGQDAKVYLASAELAVVTSLLGKIPTVDEYMDHYSQALSKGDDKDDIYRYLRFNEMEYFVNAAERED